MDKTTSILVFEMVGILRLPGAVLLKYFSGTAA